MKTYPVPNIIPKNTVMNANLTSSAQQLQNAIGFAIQVVFTGTPTGTFKLQASADPADAANATGKFTAILTKPNNWTDITDSSQAVSAAGDITWNYTSPNYNWVRVIYTDGSSGTSPAVIVSCTFNGKGF